MKKVLITGITGQDGSYLSELLLEKEYQVHGMIRRSSSLNTFRIDHLCENPRIYNKKFFLHFGDLSDGSNINRIIEEIQPDEIFHLGAQSHVRVSFDLPEYTGDVTGLSTTRILDAIKKNSLKTKFYQASSSEMFGKIKEIPAKETTPFHPRSPYACAKVYAYWITRNYREAYNMFACNGILFNHESIPGWTPVLIRKNNLLDLLPIEEVMPNFTHSRRRVLENVEVWEDGQFVRATLATAYPHNSEILDKGLTEIEARSGFIETTRDHIIFSNKGEVKAGKLQKEEELQEAVHYPEPLDVCKVVPEWARFLGIFVGDGYAGWSDGKFVAQIRSDNKRFLEKTGKFWQMTTGGGFSFGDTRSGFTKELKKEGLLRLYGASGILEWLANACYTKSRHKRVPKLILNAGLEAWREFIEGYNMADGLKAGHGKYKFKNFKTNSSVLASQLMWMADKALHQRTVLNVDRVYRDGEEYKYFSINLNTPTPSGKGAGLLRNRNAIKRIRTIPHRGYLFDLTTETGKFTAGVGNLLIHNSPRRGETFVTKKITRGLVRIKLGKEKKLYLGNLDAKRDWGYAKDYVEGMWMMLQQKEPDDYILATNEAHSVREFVEKTAKWLDIDLVWQDKGVKEKGIDKKTNKIIIEIDPILFRPAEVEELRGDYSRAKKKLGWKPKVRFDELVELMVKADYDNESKK